MRNTYERERIWVGVPYRGGEKVCLRLGKYGTDILRCHFSLNDSISAASLNTLDVVEVKDARKKFKK